MFIMSVFFLLETLGGPAKGLLLILLAFVNSIATLFFVLLRRWPLAKWLALSNIVLLIAGVILSLLDASQTTMNFL